MERIPNLRTSPINETSPASMYSSFDGWRQ